MEENYSTIVLWGIECDECAAEISCSFKTQEEAVEAWNKRIKK